MLQKVMHTAIGWPVESKEEAGAARGATSPFLLSEGMLSGRCFKWNFARTVIERFLLSEGMLSGRCFK